MNRIAACALLAAALLNAQAPSGPLVVNHRWPRATDLVSWTKDVMRIEGVENGPETRRASVLQLAPALLPHGRGRDDPGA